MKRTPLDAAGRIVEMQPILSAPTRTKSLGTPSNGAHEDKFPFLTPDHEKEPGEIISNRTEKPNSTLSEADVVPSSPSGNKTSDVSSTLTEKTNSSSGETEVTQSSSSGNNKTTEITSTTTAKPSRNPLQAEVTPPSSSENKTSETTSEPADQSNPDSRETEVTPSSSSGNTTPSNLIKLELWWDGKERKYLIVTDEQIKNDMYFERRRYAYIKVVGKVASAKTSECVHLKPIRWMHKSGPGVNVFIVNEDQYKQLIEKGYDERNTTIGYAVEKQGLCGANHHISEYQRSPADYLIQTDNFNAGRLKSKGYYEKRIGFYLWKL
ncbi:hypothetical protein TTRE_0000485001 [Trichuris trichiura]|uniref:Uncharacterized protein n=1 Tax=Trichuris trichiura TaxID=36087 RepID=A0A077ZD99_TRITR|nr:hypothetical protein TTRE_0000485001 [Trichuris trichiura]